MCLLDNYQGLTVDIANVSIFSIKMYRIHDPDEIRGMQIDEAWSHYLIKNWNEILKSTLSPLKRESADRSEDDRKWNSLESDWLDHRCMCTAWEFSSDLKK